MTPTLLVGLPGCGKSRMARRIAEELKTPFHALSFAGMGDSRAILGTARGWSGGQPSPILNLMVSGASASQLVLLDELDKARSDTKNDIDPTSALLNLLEPESARCWYDTYLQTPCDLTKLMFLATANLLSPIPKPLLSRLRVVLVPEPRREDFRTIARGALVDIAREWDLPERTFESVGDAMTLGAARNAREIRAFARAYLHDWARKTLGPGRRH
jgi:ATP-dependent Lon protease